MESDPSSRKQSVAMGFIFMAGVAILLLQWIVATYNTVDTIPFSEFEQLVAQGNVTEVAVGQETIQGKLKERLHNEGGMVARLGQVANPLLSSAVIVWKAAVIGESRQILLG